MYLPMVFVLLSNAVVDLRALNFMACSFSKNCQYIGLVCRLPRVSHSPSSGFHGSTTAMHSNPLSYVYLHETCYKTERISGDCEHKMCCAIYALAPVYPFNVSKTFTDEYLKRKCLELMHNQLLPLPYELIAKLCNTPASSEFI